MSTDLVRAAQRRTDAEAELAAARDALHDQIVAALAAGTRQVDIVRVTGYTREQVRRIARSATADLGSGAPHSPA